VDAHSRKIVRGNLAEPMSSAKDHKPVNRPTITAALRQPRTSRLGDLRSFAGALDHPVILPMAKSDHGSIPPRLFDRDSASSAVDAPTIISSTERGVSAASTARSPSTSDDGRHLMTQRM
jgi:hypothetical protein